MPRRRSGDYASMRLRGSQTRVEFARASIKASPQSGSAGEPCGGSDRWHNDSPQTEPAPVTRSGPAIDHLQGSGNSLIVAAFLTGKVAIGCACRGMSESGHRSCKCGAVYDRSEHIEEAARSVALNAPCAARRSRIGTPLGCLDIGSSPVQPRNPSDSHPKRPRDSNSLAKSIN
jgi:hypothetical protein